MSGITKKDAASYLQAAIGSDGEFRPHQWEAIDALVNQQKRILLVQRTGWGKSTVYFIATRALREQGAGPTLIISPLLALMSNQIQDAESQLGLEAVTINSNNTEEWDNARSAVVNDECDLLLVSPERLANPEFRRTVIAETLANIGLLVVDEAHCISDWGHDFRPDYRRIKSLVDRLPEDTPVAATTATANDRVVEDVRAQLPGIETLRGKLFRDSLYIQALDLGERPRRLAWLAENIPETPPAGIIYCLTTEDVEAVAAWLSDNGVDAAAYHGRMEGERRRSLEEQLLANEVDALVATNALGMGFNKPDLKFVIHFQRPPNLIRYYQEIGRTGRALDEAYAILLTGDQDDDIAEYFIENAFPQESAFDRVLSTLDRVDEPLYRYELLKRLDLAAGTIETCLKILRLDGAVSRVDNGYVSTGVSWEYDTERVKQITAQRRRELKRIQRFVETDECLAKFIDDTLDGQLDSACGQCANCEDEQFPVSVENKALIASAVEHYRSRGGGTISPRKQIPEKRGTYQQIPESKQFNPGYALAQYDDPGWGQLVRTGIESGSFDDRLLEGAQSRIKKTWNPSPPPSWVTAIPSKSQPGLVMDFAERLASELDLPFLEVVTQVRPTAPQRELQNSYQQCWNILGAYEIPEPIDSGPVLLVDDTVGSRWTFTEVARHLREAGSGPVHPFALASRR